MIADVAAVTAVAVAAAAIVGAVVADTAAAVVAGTKGQTQNPWLQTVVRDFVFQGRDIVSRLPIFAHR